MDSEHQGVGNSLLRRYDILVRSLRGNYLSYAYFPNYPTFRQALTINHLLDTMNSIYTLHKLPKGLAMVLDQVYYTGISDACLRVDAKANILSISQIHARYGNQSNSNNQTYTSKGRVAIANKRTSDAKAMGEDLISVYLFKIVHRTSGSKATNIEDIKFNFAHSLAGKLPISPIIKESLIFVLFFRNSLHPRQLCLAGCWSDCSQYIHH